MALADQLRTIVKAARKRGAPWVRWLEVARLALDAEGLGALWTRIRHGGEVHQTTPFTRDDRYPELFELARTLRPDAARILSFGCSTGEELLAIRRRFPRAEIVGAEINLRSRGIAERRLRGDPLFRVVGPEQVTGRFAIVFCLAVLQREPHKVAELDLENLSGLYPFAKFDQAVTALVERLEPAGLLCIDNAHYRVEDSTAFGRLEAVAGAPLIEGLLFGPEGRRSKSARAATMFRKAGAA